MSAIAIRDQRDFEAAMNAIIIYDDFELAEKANATLGRAARDAGETTLWSVKPWRVHLLTQAGAASAALADGADAHLVVLALRAAEPLPAWLLAWLEQWAANRQVPDAALAIFTGRSGAECLAPATGELSQFVQRHGLGVVFGGGEAAEDESAVFAHDLHQRAVTQTSTLLGILEEPRYGHYRGWGIND